MKEIYIRRYGDVWDSYPIVGSTTQSWIYKVGMKTYKIPKNRARWPDYYAANLDEIEASKQKEQEYYE